MPLNRVSLCKVSRAIVLKQLVSSVTRPDMHSCYTWKCHVGGR